MSQTVAIVVAAMITGLCTLMAAFVASRTKRDQTNGRKRNVQPTRAWRDGEETEDGFTRARREELRLAQGRRDLEMLKKKGLKPPGFQYREPFFQALVLNVIVLGGVGLLVYWGLSRVFGWAWFW
jgi:hypothetical protein